jgi:tetratricopeptide (TPR) repeat protein
VRAEAERAVRRGGGGSSRRPPEPAELDLEGAQLGRAAGPARQAKLEARLRDAARAFERERFGEARRLLRPLVEAAPGSAAVRELHGLTLYRLGRWREAAAELEALRQLTGTTEQHPVLADCYRALGRWSEVDELWDELRRASPGADLVTEGRIVAAGALADRGRLRDAIATLGRGFQVPTRPKVHHLRRAYALADLHERAGDLPHARALFERVAAADPEFADVRDRLRALR